MKIVVKKFGGVSLKNMFMIEKISKKIIFYLKKKNKIIVVVSAMGNTTDNLINLYRKTKNKIDESYDCVISAGEQISAGILNAILKKRKIKSKILLGWQIPIKTKGKYGKSKIKKINSKKILKEFKRNNVLIIPGFQGINKNGNITTLGRGGSDNTAIELANCFKSKCYLYKDVEGISFVDPKVFKTDSLKEINCYELLEMSSLGAKILQIDSVINCIKDKTKVFVLSSLNKNMKKKTKIIFKIKKIGLKSIHFSKKKLYFCKYQKNIDKLLKDFKNNNLDIDDVKIRSNEIVFSSDSCFNSIKTLIEKNNLFLKKNKKITKVSLIGLGIKNYDFNLIKIIRLLIKNKIKFNSLTSSEVSVSFFSKSNKVKIIKIFKKKYKL
ncbi:amino acid kinase family protein [Candidatus Vidania fulgoroideorum]